MRAAWWSGALATSVLLGLVAMLAVVLVPGFATEMKHSFTRMPAQFVELAFADEKVARACVVSGGRVVVQVEVRSHLSDPKSLPWTATTEPSGRTYRGVLRPQPGATEKVSLTLEPKKSGFTLTFALDGRREHLVLHCDQEGGG